MNKLMTSENKKNGLEESQLLGCGVTMVGYVVIPT
jgi:hypothetical protein